MLQRMDQGGEGAGWERDCTSEEVKGLLSLQCLPFLCNQNSNDHALTQMHILVAVQSPGSVCVIDGIEINAVRIF